MVRCSRFAFDDSHESPPPLWDSGLPFDEADGDLPIDVLLNLPDESPPADDDSAATDDGQEDHDDWSRQRAA